MSGFREISVSRPREVTALEYQGNPVSEGIAVGKVLRYERFTPKIEEKTLRPEEVEPAVRHYEEARGGAKAELEHIRDSFGAGGEDKKKIITAHLDILMDVAMDEEIRQAIHGKMLPAENAIQKVYSKYIRRIGKAKDALIRERATDMKDVCTRILRNCAGVREQSLAVLPSPVIVFADDLFPSDTASLDRSKVLAIVTEVGGPTSHTAIIARSYEIPALLGVADALRLVADGERVIVDAVDGRLITQPTEEQVRAYEKKRAEFAKKAAETKKYIGIKPVTADGEKIEVELNIGSASVPELQGSKYTTGVGLFRTEFLYMGRDTLPTEEEQYDIYRKVLTEFGDRPVTLRTLDIGGDKKLDCMDLPKEDNPFLGNRALRLCLSHRDLFKTQLRAALRAGTIGNLWIMFPMVGSLDDIRNAKQVVQEVRGDLDREHIPYGKNIKIGIMIEIPSIAMIADLAVKEVDFASIGTNDLCQYTTAADRLNPTVAPYYQSYHPAMFRLIRYVAQEFKKAGKPLCVCGEMGGDKLAMPVLLGFGIRRISMGLASVANVKRILSRLTVARAEELAENVCRQETAADAAAYLKSALADIL
jgi:phosphotransferase system enzyme I (PtsI)